MTSQRHYPKREIVAVRKDEALDVMVDVLSCGHEVMSRRDYKGAQDAERRACAACCVEKFSRQMERHGL